MTQQQADGDCFVAAFRTALHSDGSLHDKIKVVHGTVHTQKYGRIVHAWNELGDVVFDNSNGHSLSIRRENYYRVLQVRDTVVYTRRQALRLGMRTKHYGPWEAEK